MEVDPPMMFQHWGGFRTIEGFSFEMAAEVDFWEHYCPKCWPVDPGIPRNPFMLQTPICNCNRRWWTLREASPSPETTTTSKKQAKDGTEGLSLIQKLHFNQISSILRWYRVIVFHRSFPFSVLKGKATSRQRGADPWNLFVFVSFWLAASHFPFWYWILGGQVRKQTLKDIVKERSFWLSRLLTYP